MDHKKVDFDYQEASDFVQGVNDDLDERRRKCAEANARERLDMDEENFTKRLISSGYWNKDDSAQVSAALGTLLVLFLIAALLGQGLGFCLGAGAALFVASPFVKVLKRMLE